MAWKNGNRLSPIIWNWSSILFPWVFSTAFFPCTFRYVESMAFSVSFMVILWLENLFVTFIILIAPLDTVPTYNTMHQNPLVRCWFLITAFKPQTNKFKVSMICKKTQGRKQKEELEYNVINQIMVVKYVTILTFLGMLLCRLFLVTIFDSSSRPDRIWSHTVAISSTWHDRVSPQISANCCVILSLTWLSTCKKNH